MDSTKRCRKCGAVKPLDDFPRDASRADGRFPWCRPCHSTYQTNRVKSNPAKRQERNDYELRWYHEHKAESRAIRNRYNAHLRERILDGYGHACACCGVKESAFLALDHVRGDGGGHNRPAAEIGANLYHRLQREGFPKDRFRLLCHSCHSAISYYGYCPHAGRPEQSHLSKMKRLRLRRRHAVIARWGGRCACCDETTWEFLHVDHVNNDGAEERRRLGMTSVRWYNFLLSDACEIDRYQLLCGSCHLAMSFYKFCPHDRERESVEAS